MTETHPGLDRWNERYSKEGYLFGEAPNAFLARQEGCLPPGGPPERESMYTEGLLREHFGDWEIDLPESHDAEVDEGEGHSGMPALIDLVARKPD